MKRLVLAVQNAALILGSLIVLVGEFAAEWLHF
jgi:hypothetical protein